MSQTMDTTENAKVNEEVDPAFWESPIEKESEGMCVNYWTTKEEALKASVGNCR